MKRIPKKLAHHLSIAEDRGLDAPTAQVDATLALVHAIREQTEVLANLVAVARETTDRLAALTEQEQNR